MSNLINFKKKHMKDFDKIPHEYYCHDTHIGRCPYLGNAREKPTYKQYVRWYCYKHNCKIYSLLVGYDRYKEAMPADCPANFAVKKCGINRNVIPDE